MKNLLDDNKGTALLIALLVMGVFIAISLALSSLIFRELRITKDLVSSGKAYYAAESGVELALYKLNNNLPGWEPQADKDDYKFVKLGASESSVAEYRVKNRCTAYPCFDEEEFDHGSVDNLMAYYDVLELNESISLPLFIVEEGRDGELKEVPVKNFTVEFFTPFDPVKDLKFSSFDIERRDWDLLRWKIYGIHKGDNTQITQSISDLAAVSSVSNVGIVDGNFGDIPASPSWFGTVSCSDSVFDTDSIRYNTDITCLQYGGSLVEFSSDGEESASWVCSNNQAKEYYNYGIDNKLEAEEKMHCYPIKDFIDEHKFNYLTLTNMMNPDVLSDEFGFYEKKAKSRIYYRVELFGDESDPSMANNTVREYATINANGYSGNSKQSIDVNLKRGSLMPVFNFSLYSTYKGKED